MSKDARKKFESRRYRQQVMLNEIVVQSRRRLRPDAESHANKILQQLTELRWTNSSTSSMAELDEFEKKITIVGSSVEVVFSHKQSHPQWLRLLAVGLPAFFILFFGFLVLERRRRLKSLSAEEVESFAETDGEI